MPDASVNLTNLVKMSRELGLPEKGYVILGEGNTAARADADSFWVKASGYQLHNIEAEGFVRVNIASALVSLEQDLDDAGVAAALNQAKCDPAAPRPSVETFLHAIAIAEAGAQFVGHTHATAVNRILCSNMAEEVVNGRLFPDEIVSCGPASLYMPYCDPGLTLSREFRQGIRNFTDKYGAPPKVILIQNHGLIVLGQTPAEVLATTAMTVKSFEILWGSYALGGPHFFTPQQISRIATRPDEHHRRTLLNK